MTKYGYFDDEKREYVITDPKTPVKWINYIGSLDFGGFVDHTGGMLVCGQDPALNRILKYIPQLPASDFKGSTIYLRVKQDSGYRVFAPFFVPALDTYDLFECHIGLGYTRIISEMFGLRTEVTVFVPIGGKQVIQDLQITNLMKEAVDVDVIPVVEYTHPDALKQFNNADWVPQTMQSQAVTAEDGCVTLLQAPFMFKDIKVNYYTSNYPVASFETDRQKFLGANGYGSWAHPLSLQLVDLSNSLALRGDNIAALCHNLPALQSNETRRIVMQLGQAHSYAAALEDITSFRETAVVDTACAKINQFWDGYLSKMQVNTPDADFNRMLNIHNPRQCYITMNWSRYLSLYQLGLGARGMGVRDSSQDVIGALASAQKEGKALLCKLLQVQNPNGSAMHQFNPLTMEANAGDSREKEDGPGFYSDDHLWTVLAVTAYLKESGDMVFLDEQIPFYCHDCEAEQIEMGTVWEHLQRAVAFTRRTVGRHGLPLLGFADWNDTVNLGTGAESLFTANLYGWALRELIELAEVLGATAVAQNFTSAYIEMQQRVNERAWDGDWYVRYFDADGRPIGSHTNEAGQIFTNGQSWPVLSGFATSERAKQALDAVQTRLNTVNGIKLSTPGYNGYDSQKGGVTTYPPGAKENGGIFLHANPWVIMAETLIGNGDRAYAYYKQINPAAKNDCIDEFECEPYVYPQNILGDEHPQFGLARNSWLTGTAAWMYQSGTQYILGIKPTYSGLIVNPCIPQPWPGFQVSREFRGARYEIEVDNAAGVSRGVTAVYVDDQPIKSQIVPIFSDGQTHHVRVILG
ncbi:MAG: hypothetical protein KDE48_11870 [Anaerolineales bacterium]|nr:hypothetical protein [Anaerolineales bacterium]